MIAETAILSTSYFPNIQYISKLLCHKQAIIDIHETYLKQSYRNRCVILGANGSQSLIIPVIKPYGSKTKTKDIVIEYVQDWQANHWKAIVSAYRHSPFFEILEAEFAPLYKQKVEKLIDWNQICLNQLWKSAGIKIHTPFSSDYIIPGTQEYDFRTSINPKERLQEKDFHYEPLPYFQVFSNKWGYVHNLSFLDLLFNEGPQAIYICRQHFTKKLESKANGC